MIGRPELRHAEDMDARPPDVRDLRIEAYIGDSGRLYRVTHIPTGYSAEAGTLPEAFGPVNAFLAAES